MLAPKHRRHANVLRGRDSMTMMRQSRPAWVTECDPLGQMSAAAGA